MSPPIPYTWGNNFFGQLGNNSGTITFNTPVKVVTSGVLSGKTLTTCSAGGFHSLVLDSAGKVYSWGGNFSGQLGDGTLTNRKVPVAVNTAGVLSGKVITAIAGGGTYTLALDSNGQIYTWGYNEYGQLGNGTTTTSSVPVAVDTSGVLNGKTIVAIAAGYYTCLVLDSEGQLYTWGWGYYGELGNGTNDLINVYPVLVDMSGVLSGKVIASIAADGFHCAVTDTAGKVYTWGWNDNGQLGDNSTTSSNVPVAVDDTGVLSGKTIPKVKLGVHHSIALDTVGQVYTWGKGTDGQLGNAASIDSDVPVTMGLGGKVIEQISGGSHHTLVMDSTHKVYACGDGFSGQLGNGANTDSNVLVAVNTSGGLSGKIIVDSSAGYDFSLVLAKFP